VDPGDGFLRVYRVPAEDVTADTTFLPEPVVLVMENIDDLTTVYRLSRSSGREDSLVLTLASVIATLPAEQSAEVLGFMARGAQGADFTRQIVDQLETQWPVRAMLSDPLPGDEIAQPMDDVVGLAEWLGVNLDRAFAYQRALSQYPPIAGVLLNLAVADIIVAAQRTARTRMGQRVKIEQAEKTFALLARKARRVVGDPAAAAQAVWCNALVATLKPVRKA
jgi:hypothetical protein